MLCLIEDYLLGEPNRSIFKVLHGVLRLVGVIAFQFRGALDGVPDQAGAGGRGELVVGVKRGKRAVEFPGDFFRDLAGPVVLGLSPFEDIPEERVLLDLLLDEAIEDSSLPKLGRGVVRTFDPGELLLQVG